MWRTFRSWPLWIQIPAWILLWPIVWSVWVLQKRWRLWIRVGLALGAWALVGWSVFAPSSSSTNETTATKTSVQTQAVAAKHPVNVAPDKATPAKDSAPAPREKASLRGGPASVRVHRQTKETRACGDYRVQMDRWACRDSYNWCSIGAKAKVRSYYNDQGPTLDTIAMRYAKDTYLDGPAWQAGYGGCMAALGDAYDSLYAH